MVKSQYLCILIYLVTAANPCGEFFFMTSKCAGPGRNRNARNKLVISFSSCFIVVLVVFASFNLVFRARPSEWKLGANCEHNFYCWISSALREDKKKAKKKRRKVVREIGFILFTYERVFGAVVFIDDSLISSYQRLATFGPAFRRCPRSFAHYCVISNRETHFIPLLWVKKKHFQWIEVIFHILPYFQPTASFESTVISILFGIYFFFQYYVAFLFGLLWTKLVNF